MIYRIICISLCALLVGCENTKENIEIPEATSIINDVKSLETDIEKRLFLEQIHEQYLEMREDIRKMEITYGIQSKEVMGILLKKSELDALHLSKIEQYLKSHGYPSIPLHGVKACRAPIFVVQVYRKISQREEIFPYLYDGYVNQNIEPSMFSEYLNGMHRIKFGERFRLPNPYREEVMIKELMQKLDLKISPNKI